MGQFQKVNRVQKVLLLSEIVSTHCIIDKYNKKKNMDLSFMFKLKRHSFKKKKKKVTNIFHTFKTPSKLVTGIFNTTQCKSEYREICFNGSEWCSNVIYQQGLKGNVRQSCIVLWEKKGHQTNK